MTAPGAAANKPAEESQSPVDATTGDQELAAQVHDGIHVLLRWHPTETRLPRPLARSALSRVALHVGDDNLVPPGHQSNPRTEVTRMEDQRRLLGRRAVLFGVPLLYLMLGLLHPTSNPELGDETGLFVNLHIAQLFLIMGLAYLLWLLVEGLDSRAATVARALIIPFVVAYTALDAVLGIAWGIAAESANDLPAAEQRGAGRLIDELISGNPDPRGLILYWGAGLVWLAVALAVVVALGDTAPRGALVLMALGALLFALGHAPPMGPVGMALFLAGTGWLELRPRRDDAGQPAALRGDR